MTAVDPLVQEVDPRQGSFVVTGEGGRQCTWCRGGLEVTARIDARFCSQRCRQAAHRFGRHCQALERAAQPMRLAYADPPYPGLARRYYEGHPDYAGEVDHEELLSRLQGYDGWALSTSAEALPHVLAIVAAMGIEGVRIGAWVRGARPAPSRWPLASWEPVVYAGGRREVSEQQPLDSLSHVSRPRTTDPDRVIGSKPADFCWWLFGLLGARPGDAFDDLFPGSGGVSRAWAALEARALVPEPSSAAERDASHLEDGDTSRLELADGSPPADVLTRDWVTELRERYAQHPARVADCEGCQAFGICAHHLSAAEALARGEVPCPTCGAEAGEACKGRCAAPPRAKRSRAAAKGRQPARALPEPSRPTSPDAFAVACPTCGAKAGEPCQPQKDPSRRDWTHAKRQLASLATGGARRTAGRTRRPSTSATRRPSAVDADPNEDPSEWCRWCDESLDPDHFCPGDVDEIVCDPDHSEAYVWCPSCGAEPREPCIPIDGEAMDLEPDEVPDGVHNSRGVALLVSRYGHNRLETSRSWERLTLSPGREVWCPRRLLERWADDLKPGELDEGSAVEPRAERDQGDDQRGARP